MPQYLNEQGEPIYLDENGEPISSQEEPQEEPSTLDKIWETINKPLVEAPARLGREFSQYITTPELDDSYLTAVTKGLVGGLAEGVGNVVSGFTSPMSLGTMGAFSGAGVAARTGLPLVAKGLTYTGKALSAPFVLTGYQHTTNPELPGWQRALGVAEMAGGLAGLASKVPRASTPTPTSISTSTPAVPELVERLRGMVNKPIIEPSRLLPAGPRFISSPQGATIDLAGKINPKLAEQMNRPGGLMTPPTLINRRLRLNPNGTFTDLDNNIYYDRMGRPLSPKILDKIKKAEAVAHDEKLVGVAPKVPEIQEMRVPGTTNVAVGPKMEPEARRLLSVIATALYKGDRPKIVTKELIQNANDEYNISGLGGNIRILYDYKTNLPDGTPSRAIAVADSGRGLTPEQIYTVFTDVGRTGKLKEALASGGFGFAKAAPLLSGLYAQVKSVVVEKSGLLGKKVKVEYSFEGTPKQLLNQEFGVPLTRTELPIDTPTGIIVKTHFPFDPTKEYAWRTWADDIASSMAEYSTNLSRNIRYVQKWEGSNLTDDMSWKWLRYEDDNSPDFQAVAHNYSKSNTQYTPGDTIEVPGTRIEIELGPLVDDEIPGYHLDILNEGLYQHSTLGSYGQALPNVPKHIRVNIKSLVEEGEEGYPFTANREAISDAVEKLIKDWVKQNVRSGGITSKQKAIQKAYDEMHDLYNFSGRPFKFADHGNRLTTNEIKEFSNNPVLAKAAQVIENVHIELEELAGKLGWNPDKKVAKFGILFEGPNNEGSVTLGRHIPNPSNEVESAILINVFEHIQSALGRTNFGVSPVDRLGTALFTTLAHERAHVPGGGHDVGHSYRDADLRSSVGTELTVKMLDQLGRAFGAPNGRDIHPEIHRLLQIYRESRGRPQVTESPLLSTGTSVRGQSDITGGETTSPRGFRKSRDFTKRKRNSTWMDVFNLSRALKASIDMSAPFRQAFPLAYRKEFWKNFKTMFESFGDETAYQAVEHEIKTRDLFQHTARYRRLKGGKYELKDQLGPSIAEQAGLKFTSIDEGLGAREEAFMSKLAEKVPGVRPSNRAYTAFLNKTRADVFEALVNQYGARRDMTLMSALAEYVNNASGRGSLGRFEKNGDILNTILFSPRLMLSRLKFLNPATYIMAPKPVRLQYIKSLATIAGAGYILGELAKLSGLGEVENDPRSPDFRKIKIGDTRLDPFGGFQQYIVFLSRMALQSAKSSTSGEVYSLRERGFGRPSLATTAGRFAESKIHPTLGFGWSYLKGETFNGEPFHVGPEILKLFIPMFIEDVYDISTHNPNLIPIVAPAAWFGMSTQSYNEWDRDEAELDELYEEPPEPVEF